MIAIYGSGDLADPKVVVEGQFLGEQQEFGETNVLLRVGRGEAEGMLVRAFLDEGLWFVGASPVGQDVRLPYMTFLAMADNGLSSVMEIDAPLDVEVAKVER